MRPDQRPKRRAITLPLKALPAWATRKAAEIRRRDVIFLLEEIAETRGGVCANRIETLLSKRFRFAIERELLDAIPVAGVSRLHKEKPRERVLFPDELAVLRPALEKRKAGS